MTNEVPLRWSSASVIDCFYSRILVTTPEATVRPPSRILAIAGSDSSGGAGIQADIKTITMLGGYAMTAITAVSTRRIVGPRRAVA